MTLPILAVAGALAAEFAPDVVRWIAGDRAGEAADRIVGAAAALTGESDPARAAETIRADPELQTAFRLRLAALDAELEQAHLEDRQDARARDTAIRTAGYVNRRADLMVIGDVIGLVVCLAAMVYLTVEGTNGTVDPTVLAMNGPIGTLAGFFGAGLRDAHQFEFGSSRGSKEKGLAVGEYGRGR